MASSRATARADVAAREDGVRDPRRRQGSYEVAIFNELRRPPAHSAKDALLVAEVKVMQRTGDDGRIVVRIVAESLHDLAGARRKWPLAQDRLQRIELGRAPARVVDAVSQRRQRCGCDHRQLSESIVQRRHRARQRLAGQPRRSPARKPARAVFTRERAGRLLRRRFP